jgi:hypothetical protein
VELIQQRLDMQTFIYMSNMSKAIKRAGEIWLSMARDVLVEPGRRMKSMGNGGELETVELGKPMLNQDTGQVEYQNDMSRAKFDVSVEVGPSSSSKRQATVRALLGMIQLSPDPETQNVLTSMAMMNMEGEGISEVRKYFRNRLIKMGVVEPTDSEAQQIMEEMQAQQQPDPQAIYLEAEAEKSRAQAIKATADTEHTLARTEETRAKTAEILAGIEQSERSNVVNTAKTLREVMAPEMRQPPSRV